MRRVNSMQKIYFGTSNKNTFDVISKYNKDNKFGICLNLYKYNSNLIGKFKRIQELGLNFFLDNGSFERWTEFLEGKVSEEEYFNFNNSYHFFSNITDNYFKILEEASDPKKIILTIPEVIGSSELTQQLQQDFIHIYKKLEEKCKCKIIIPLQFNPNSEEWFEEVKNGARFIKDTIPTNWIVGIPFGNDFKIIAGRGKRARKNFRKVVGVFRSILKNYKAHLFGCGSMTKLERYVKPYRDILYSIDASSIMHIASNSHYLSTESHRLLDIRYMNGKKGSKILNEKKKKELLRDSGLTLEEWTDKNYSERFDMVMKNYVKILKDKGIYTKFKKMYF
jgi:hypothetical protein